MRSKVIIWWFNTTWLIIQQFQRFGPSLFHLSEPKKVPHAVTRSRWRSVSLETHVHVEATGFSWSRRDTTSLRPENLSAPYLSSLQMDVTPGRINSASFWLFSSPRRGLFCSPPSFTVTHHSPNGYLQLHFITSAGHRHRLLSAGNR